MSNFDYRSVFDVGKFDYVNYSCKCPVCDSTVSNFQTKDCEKQFLIKTLDDVNAFYGPCQECNTWIQFQRLSGVKKQFQETILNSVPKLIQDVIGKIDNNDNDQKKVKNELNSFLANIESKSNIDNFLMSYYPMDQ